jgi:acetoin utilization protein AcuB
MFVRMWMTPDVITVPPETPILEAQDIMKKHGVRRLPVVNKRGKLVGIVTKSDILEAGPSDATTLSVWELNYLLARTTVEQIMVKADDLITVSP